MLNCPVCNRSYQTKIDFCENEDCEWEFKYFLSTPSKETLDKENKRLEIARKKHEKLQSLDLKTKKSQEKIKDDEKKCPFCSEIIKLESIKCRFCGEFLNIEQEAIIEEKTNLKTKITPEFYENEYADYFDNENISDGLARAEKGGKWGFSDEKGKFIILPQFDSSNNFKEGFAIVEKNKKYGFIDEGCNLLGNSWFDKVSNFSEGLAYVKIDDSYDAYIDKLGKYVAKFKFDLAEDFKGGVARVKKNDKWNFIDKSGNLLSNTWFDLVFNFNDLRVGFAWVNKNDKWIFIDKSGTWFDDVCYFKDGLARVQKNEKWNFIDTSGKLLTNTWFDDVSDFEDGKAWVEVTEKTLFGLSEKIYQYYYINKNGEKVN